MPEIDGTSEAKRTSVREPSRARQDWVLGEAAASAGSPVASATGETIMSFGHFIRRRFAWSEVTSDARASHTAKAATKLSVGS